MERKSISNINQENETEINTTKAYALHPDMKSNTTQPNKINAMSNLIMSNVMTKVDKECLKEYNVLPHKFDYNYLPIGNDSNYKNFIHLKNTFQPFFNIDPHLKLLQSSCQPNNNLQNFPKYNNNNNNNNKIVHQNNGNLLDPLKYNTLNMNNTINPIVKNHSLTNDTNHNIQLMSPLILLNQNNLVNQLNTNIHIGNNTNYRMTANNCYCVGCSNKIDCGKCSVCLRMHKFGGPFSTTSKRCIKRQCIVSNKLDQQIITNMDVKNMNRGFNFIKNQSFPINNNIHVSTYKNMHPHSMNNNQISHQKFISNTTLSKRKQDVTCQSSSNTIERSCGKVNVVCLAIGCCKASRMNSKYCSETCCLKVNLIRMVTKMRQIKSNDDINNYPSHQHDQHKMVLLKRRIENLQKKMDLCKDIRTKFFHYLNNRPLSCKNSKLHENLKSTTISQFKCVCCGNNFSAYNAVKHVECCYTKIEKIYTYYTPVPSNEEFMCDKHLKKQDGYCKRLFSNCVDHKNIEKYENNVICGFFLERNSDQLLQPDIISRKYDDACSTPRNKCIIHFGWERTRLANIEQILQNINISKNNAKEQLLSIETRLKNRKSLITRFLHNI